MAYMHKDIDGVKVFYNKKLDIIRVNQDMVMNNEDKVAYQRTTKEIYDICFEVTQKCNLFCRNCFANASPNNKNVKELELDKIREILNKKRDKIIRATISGGEPLLYSKIEQLLSIPSEYNDINFVLNTNVSIPLKKSIIKMIDNNNWLVACSLHGDKITHNTYTRSYSFTTALNNVRLLHNVCFIHIYSVINIYMTRNDIDFLLDLARNREVDFLRFIIPRPFGRYDTIDEFPIIEYIKEKIEYYSIDNVRIKYSQSNTFFVNANGDIGMEN